MTDRQHTLRSSFTLEGKGLHTGLPIKITFNPAPVNHGYKIQRVDIKEKPIINALAENVVNTQRGTVLGLEGGTVVSTIEHAMAALYALQIDNCLIEVNAPEFPILDGSSKFYVEEMLKVGLEEQNEEREFYIVRRKMEVIDEETGSKITLLPDENFCINSFIEFNSEIIPNQSATLEDITQFPQKIASARTFVFVREIQQLFEAGLIKGGDLDNAIVLYEKEVSQNELDNLAGILNLNIKLDATKLGYLNSEGLEFPNEPARHKLLDIIGDFALIGKPIIGRVIATRPGHKINNEMARTIRKEIRLNEVQPPVYDPNLEPVFDINKIKSMLPHRYPFLMVDKIVEIGQKHIIGIKNISANEPFFQGHFPQEPVMPGVLQVESMAQIGGLLVLSQVDEPERYSTYFLKIDNVKFRSKVIPGDTLIFRLQLISEIRRGIAIMKGFTFVGEKLVSEAEFTAQIVKNK